MNKPGFRPIDEVNYRALRLIVERAEGGGLARRREMAKIDAAYKNGTLVLPDSETEDQRWWRCEARFMLGDYSDWGGWQYRDKWAAGVWFTNPFKCPVWKGEWRGHPGRIAPPVELGVPQIVPEGQNRGNLNCQRLYIVGEQGIGDEILFSSVIEDACRAVGADQGPTSFGSVVIECQNKIASVLERNFRRRGFNVETRSAKLIDDFERGEGYLRVAQEPEEVGATAWVTMGELCRVYRRKPEDFPRKPYLSARGQDAIHRHGRVCISWRGAQGSIPLDKLLKMYPEALSVQYDQAWDEDVERPKMVDLRDDIEEVMRVLTGCEKLVTVSTSVAHIAAAMGVKTDLILADKGTGRRGTLFPWKWWSEARSKDGVTCTSQWYGDHVRVYRNWRAYENEIRNEARRRRHEGRGEAREAA